jgi:hypothetical protein
MIANSWNTIATFTDLSFVPIYTCDVIVNNDAGRPDNPASLICLCRFYSSDGVVDLRPYVNNPTPRFSTVYITKQ